jgi:hypothetical protein
VEMALAAAVVTMPKPAPVPPMAAQATTQAPLSQTATG